MVHLGWTAWLGDVEALRRFRHSGGKSQMLFKPQILFVSYFLAALAIENLLKGLFVVAHPDSVSAGEIKRNTLKSHWLIDLASEAGVCLSSEEKEFCRLGTEAILSFGRYHIGKRSSESPTHVTINGAAFEVYSSLYERLMSDLKKKPFATNSATTPRQVN